MNKFVRMFYKKHKKYIGIYLQYFHMTKFSENYIHYVELDEDYEYAKKNPRWILFSHENDQNIDTILGTINT